MGKFARSETDQSEGFRVAHMLPLAIFWIKLASHKSRVNSSMTPTGGAPNCRTIRRTIFLCFKSGQPLGLSVISTKCQVSYTMDNPLILDLRENFPMVAWNGEVPGNLPNQLPSVNYGQLASWSEERPLREAHALRPLNTGHWKSKRVGACRFGH